LIIISAIIINRGTATMTKELTFAKDRLPKIGRSLEYFPGNEAIVKL
jgi:hypothetical protein